LAGRCSCFFDPEPLTEPGVAMVAAMLRKVDLDQGVTGNFGRTGENRAGRPNVTELSWLGGGAGQLRSI